METAPVLGEVRPPLGRTRHPYFMHDMIRRQPTALQSTLGLGADSIGQIPAPAEGRALLCVGTGTSFHAADAVAGAVDALPDPHPGTVAATAFDVAREPDRFGSVGAALVFSSSGETLATIDAMRRLKERSVPITLVSGTERSTSTELADHLLPTRYAEESSWTHTVSYTTAIAAGIALLGAWRGPGAEPILEPDGVRDCATEAIALESRALELVDRLGGSSRAMLLGSGGANVTAREAALKLREATGRFAGVNGVEEFLHGTLPSIGPDSLVVAITRSTRERDRAMDGLRASAKLGAVALLVDSSGPPPQDPDVVVWTVRCDPPIAAPIYEIMPLQLLAYWLAVSDGRNPDVMGLDDPRQMAARKTFAI
jgi:glucosamine--fructose-6-phosphate aminotransferase (isomerizing)